MAPDYTVLPATAATDVIGSITGFLGDNIAVVVTLFGFGVALTLTRKMFNKAGKGKGI